MRDGGKNSISRISYNMCNTYSVKNYYYYFYSFRSSSSRAYTLSLFIYIYYIRHCVSVRLCVYVYGQNRQLQRSKRTTSVTEPIVLYLLLSPRFSRAKFRSGVSGIPVRVSRLNCSRCASDPTVCVRYNNIITILFYTIL